MAHWGASCPLSPTLLLDLHLEAGYTFAPFGDSCPLSPTLLLDLRLEAGYTFAPFGGNITEHFVWWYNYVICHSKYERSLKGRRCLIVLWTTGLFMWSTLTWEESSRYKIIFVYKQSNEENNTQLINICDILFILYMYIYHLDKVQRTTRIRDEHKTEARHCGTEYMYVAISRHTFRAQTTCLGDCKQKRHSIHAE